jgi:hypothetical protein
MRTRWDCSPATARLVLAALVVTSTALAVRWVFLVPIFQSPDEHHHFDYALSINENGGLFQSADEPRTTLAHPWTRHLQRCCETTDVTFESAARLPADYGTRAYFAAIDATAPRPVGPLARVPGVAGHYPFGYYAALAVWLQGARLATGDSPVGLFFAGRLFSVLLLGVSLVLSYAVARQLGARRWSALLLVGCAGCFPLTSFVASYVQPDNLGFTLVSLSFYLALRAGARPGNVGLRAGLGLALGLLLVTKPHFFLCVLAPTLALLASRRLTSTPATRLGLLGLAALALPAALLGVLQLHLTRHTHHHCWADPAPYTDFRSFYLEGLLKALRDYCAGTTHRSFWGVFGWLDTPLVFGSEAVTAWVRLAILAGSWLVLGLTWLRLGQVTVRLVRAARKGHARRAVQAACANVPVNSYFAFAVFMVALHVRLDNGFGAQGRNWFPFLLPIFWTALFYAPAALRRWGNWAVAVASGAAALALVFYATAGSYYALASVARRYYHTAQEVAEARRHPAVVRLFSEAGDSVPAAALVLREASVRCEPEGQPHRLGPRWFEPHTRRPLDGPQTTSFTCPCDELRGAEVLLARGDCDPDGTVTLAVLDGDRLLASSTVAAGRVGAAMQWFPLRGLAGLKGRELRLRLSCRPAPGTTGVVAAVVAPDPPCSPCVRLFGTDSVPEEP